MCTLFGGMQSLPAVWPQYCMDLQQMWVQQEFPRGVKPRKPADAHHALADARWNKKFHERLRRNVCDGS
jgi:hypothetical protein